MDPGTFGALPPIDLSKVIKLRDVEFRPNTPSVKWVVMVLQTVKSKNLRQIRIHSRHVTFAKPIGETILQEWRNLDCLLVQLWTSHSIRPEFECGQTLGGGGLIDLAPGLLPELTSKGAIDFI